MPHGYAFTHGSSSISPQGNLHPSLTPGAQSLEYCVERFRYAVQLILTKYGKSVMAPGLLLILLSQLIPSRSLNHTFFFSSVIQLISVIDPTSPTPSSSPLLLAPALDSALVANLITNIGSIFMTQGYLISMTV